MLEVAPEMPPGGADEDQGERAPDSKPPFWMMGALVLQPDVAEARAVDDVGGDADDTLMVLETDGIEIELETDGTELELEGDDTGLGLETDDIALELEIDDTGCGFGLLHLYNHQRVSGSSNHNRT